MSINVYWAPLCDPSPGSAICPLNYPAPERVLPELNQIPVHVETGVMQCPSFNETLKNTYAIKCPFDIKMKYQDSDGWHVESGIGPDIVRGRSHSARTASIMASYIFVCEQPLQMEVRQATYHLNEFTNNTILYGAKVDIGRYFRGTECAFHVRNNCNNLTVNYNDTLYYITFETTEPVRLVKFEATQEIITYSEYTLKARNCTSGKRRKLEHYYNMYVKSLYHKKIIKLVKENILD